MTSTVAVRHVALMSFLRFVRYEMEQHLLIRRWWLPLPIMLFVVYIVLSSVLIRASTAPLPSNTWDALFSVFGNQNVIFFVMTLLFLYLVSDLLADSGFSQAVLIRLSSRTLWWLGKLLVLAAAVLWYLGLTMSVVAGVSSFVLPWQTTWSAGASQFPAEFYIIPAALRWPPVSVFALLALLLALGWFSLGLLSLVVSQLSNRLIAGFIVAVLVLLSSLAVLRADIPPPYAYLFIHQHLLYYSHSFGDGPSAYLPFAASVAYWIVWIALLSFLGWRLSLRQEFFFQGHRI